MTRTGNYAGTELRFVPHDVAQAWRLLLVVALALVIGRMMGQYRDRRRSLAPWARWGQAALVLLLIRTAVVQIERFSEPVLLEGLPVSSAALVLVFVGTREYEKYGRVRDLR